MPSRLSAAVFLSAVLIPVTFAQDPPRAETNVPIRAITSGPNAHWFGYYDKLQFDPSERYALGMQVAFEDRPPEADDAIVLGMIDLHDEDRWIPFAQTRAWNWQQGAMLQWVPEMENTVLYNDRRDGRFVAVLHEVFTGHTVEIPHPIYALSPDGKTGVSINFARLDETRPGYGYTGLPDPFAAERIPENDGVYLVDLATGTAKLIHTHAEIAAINHQPTMDGGKHWFNHLLFNPDGSRIIFLHRWRAADDGPWRTRMFTTNPDGTQLHNLIDHGMVSHFIWKNPAQILAWSREPETGDRFHLYTDQTDRAEVIGEGVLTRDGHCTYSPDGEWILTDTYPGRDRMQTLMLYRPGDGKRIDLGKFYLERTSQAQLRCDLHPRWSPSGRYVSIDSKHTGQRQIYLLDVSAIVP